MAIKIPDLLEVISLDRITEVLLDAYTDYPKLMNSFPNTYERKNALEASIRFYGQFYMYFGKAFTLDEDVYEVALVVDSENANMSKSRCLKAGCYSIEYQNIKERMSPPDRKRRIQIFNQILKMEKKIRFPSKYVYIGYLGVAESKQGEGRGTRLMEIICEYADSVGRPVILFVNSDELIEFYGKFGFEKLTSVSSEKFEFTNTYLIRENKLY